MFRKTMIRLTMTNSLVFFLLFIFFGLSVYSYVAYRLFDQVDDAMHLKTSYFQIRNGRPGYSVGKLALFDPRIVVLLRGEDGRVVNPYNYVVEEIDDLTRLADEAVIEKTTVRKVGTHTYRIFSLPYQQEEKILNRPGAVPLVVKDVITVSIVDSEVALLKRLMFILLGGLFVGTVIIILAGFYLAKRALVPVRKAWAKQQQFVADASHELRTPLAVIKSNAELTLRHPSHTVEEESIRITNVIRETTRMNKLVSSLLMLARADSDQAMLNLSKFDLQDMISTVSEQFGLMAERKGLELIVEVPGPIELTADRERINQLLIILLDNAVKYTSTGKITLTCVPHSAYVQILVRDTGIGISASDLPHVFDRFYRGDKARNRDSGGAGLGLSIAEWIVKAHDGKIKVESEVGVGTEFQITLPQ